VLLYWHDLQNGVAAEREAGYSFDAVVGQNPLGPEML
jgi:hypothetical protein